MPTQSEFVVWGCTASVDFVPAGRIDALSKAIKELELSDEQKVNMSTFLEQKREILRHGELREVHFGRLAELGYGNGGVVLKVEHKPSRIIMARKVCL